MTAKEIANDAKRQISDDDFVYTFSPQDLKKYRKALFIEQNNYIKALEGYLQFIKFQKIHLKNPNDINLNKQHLKTIKHYEQNRSEDN